MNNLKNVNLRKILLTNISLLCSFIVAIELSSVLIRLIAGKSYTGFIYRRMEAEKVEEITDDCRRMRTHPILSHVHDHKNKCVVREAKIDGSWVIHNRIKNSPMIITSGGSTTDGFFKFLNDGYTWPLGLSKILNTRNQSYQIWNGGVGGYNSSQELLKLITELPKLNKKPKIIISLSGINEDPRGGKLYNHPYTTPIHLRMMKYEKYIHQDKIKRIFLPSTLSIINRLSDTRFGPPIDVDRTDSNIGKQKNWEKSIYLNETSTKGISAVDLWFKNIRIMHSLAKTYGAEYYVFLQPTMGLDDIQIPNKPESMDGILYSKSKAKNPAYFDEINQRYRLLRKKCKSVSYCFDISAIAKPNGNFYHDIRHHNAEGNKLIAEAIYKSIFDDGN